MIFKKAERVLPFTQIDNEVILDNRLSAKAKGILLYLMSRPDDWQVYETEIVTHFTDGLKSIKSGIKELITQGYITRNQNRNEYGKFYGYIYNVYDKSQNQAILTVMPKTDNGKRHTTNKDNTNTKHRLKNSLLIGDKNISIKDNKIINKKLTKQERIIIATHEFEHNEYLRKQG